MNANPNQFLWKSSLTCCSNACVLGLLILYLERSLPLINRNINICPKAYIFVISVINHPHRITLTMYNVICLCLFYVVVVLKLCSSTVQQWMSYLFLDHQLTSMFTLLCCSLVKQSWRLIFHYLHCSGTRKECFLLTSTFI